MKERKKKRDKDTVSPTWISLSLSHSQWWRRSVIGELKLNEWLICMNCMNYQNTWWVKKRKEWHNFRNSMAIEK